METTLQNNIQISIKEGVHCPENSRVDIGIYQETKRSKARSFNKITKNGSPFGPKVKMNFSPIGTSDSIGSSMQLPQKTEYTYNDKKLRLTLEHIIDSSSEEDDDDLKKE